MEIVTYAKNAGVILATTSTFAYICGYLALRARAFALGTDPMFVMLDEIYIFAGFRFVFISLIALLLLLPVILVIRSGLLWLHVHIPESLSSAGQWLLLILLVLGTLFMTVKVLSVNTLLLQFKTTGSNSILEEAIMGGASAVVLMFTVLILTVLSVLWLKMRLSIASDLFSLILGITVTIQLFLLPIFHGVLYADRQVRVLGQTPAIIQGFTGSSGIVDRSSEHVTLLGMNDKHQRRLVTIKLDELNGIPVQKVVSLKDFIEIELASSEGVKEESMPDNQNKQNTISTGSTKTGKGIFEALVDYLQITFEAIGSLGDSVVDYGQVWLVELDTSGAPSNPRRIGTLSNLAWPVHGSDGRTIYAIQNEQIVQLSDDGQLHKVVEEQKQWIKLFGVTPEYSVVGMIHEDGESKLAILQADGTIIIPSGISSEKDRKRILALMQESRSYSGNRSLFVERSSRGGRGFDVFYNNGEQVFNLSDCGDDRCGQASLSADFRRALYVRKSRY